MRDELLGFAVLYLLGVAIALADALAFGVDPLRNVVLATVAYCLFLGGLMLKEYVRRVKRE